MIALRDPRDEPRPGDAMRNALSGVTRTVVERDPYEGDVTYTSTNVREPGTHRTTAAKWRYWCRGATIVALEGRPVQ